MNEPELVRVLSRRASVPEPAAAAVLDALRDLVREGVIDAHLCEAGYHSSNPRDPHLVDDLIDRARRHPLGLDLLRDGLLGSVAAILGAHAFTVEAARERLRSEEPVLA